MFCPLLLASDPDSNFLRDSLLWIERHEAEWGDLVFNEVMADPNPEVSLSMGEYVELFNRSGYSLNIEGWRMEVGRRKYILEAVLEPGDYLLINPVSLPNEGSLMTIYNKEGVLIHAASYSLPYESLSWKEEGGWSLESPDPDQVCNISMLWEYSVDKSGGTPGRVNSVDGNRSDEQIPVFLYHDYSGPGDITLHFSEPIVLPEPLGGEAIIRPGNFSAQQITKVPPLSDKLVCHFEIDPSLISRYTFSMPVLSDCSGNLSSELSFQGGRVQSPGYGTVLINEIMYDPVAGAAEFIELYNPGQYFIDLRDLGLGISGEGEEPDVITALSDHSRIMEPGAYLVICGCTRCLMDSYGLEISGSWVELESFKSLPNSEGRIWLTDRAGNGIDVVSYGDHMHLELIDDTKGISLERIDPGRPGSDSDNWHSAASIAGYATPGRLNSQSAFEPGSGDGFHIEPGVFSPDNDGYNDLLLISPGLDETGCIIRLWITRPDGTPVRTLANNHVAGVSVTYSWDGREDKGLMASEGFYVVHLRVYHPSSGARWNRKAAIGLIYR